MKKTNSRNSAKAKPGRGGITVLSAPSAAALRVGREQKGQAPHGYFPVVGVGASAGGLEAFTQVLQALPADTGMAFVFIQHLDPKHESMLAEILGRATKMTVVEATHGVHIKPNHIFIIPPDTDLGIENGFLRVTPRKTTSRPHLPVDYFFRSLAEDQGNRSIAVVLSGTGSDGALGLEFVKSQGGITFAQKLEFAKYDGMPGAAVATGCVDFQLEPKAIAEELARIGCHPYVRSVELEKPAELLPEGDALSTVFTLLQARSGVDFSHYKRTTIYRRILRRMVLNKAGKLNDYVQFLEKNPGEVEALYQDVLIKVTSFFRDPGMFETLKKTVLAKIIKQQMPNSPIRIWVPGCSTGEETYSLAMSLMECFKANRLKEPPQIFATDISDTALAKARLGIYRDNIVTDVSPERLRRFFVRLKDGDYQVNKSLRDLCVFAKQNVVRDPPFSRLDLISCRNLLMYLDPVLQQKALQFFHYALNPGGFLVLGNAESIGGLTELFGVADRKCRIYFGKPAHVRVALDYSAGVGFGAAKQVAAKRADQDILSGVNLQKAADLLTMAKAPPNVVVDENMQILHFRGHTGDFLEPASGNSSFNLLKMARPGLLQGLRSALGQAKKSNLPARYDNLEIEYGERRKHINLEIVPIKASAKSRHFIVFFEDVAAAEMSGKTGPHSRRGKARPAERQAEQLKRELVATKDILQANVEEQENTNQELKSANEEILSSNEELQSTNEELETAKEELQSTNEELKTVNDELQTSLEQTTRMLEWMQAIVEHRSQALLVLDENLQVMKVNQAFCELFKVSPAETEHKLVYDLGNGQWNLPDLRKLLLDILANDKELRGYEVTCEFPGLGRRTMQLDAHYIRWGVAQQKMILLGFEDITQRKEAQERLLAAEQAANRAKDEFIATLSHELRTPLSSILAWSQMLRSKKLDEATATRAYEVIERNAKTQAQLIEDLLDISRIVTGKLKLALRPIELKAALVAALDAVRPTADANKVQLEAEIDPCTCYVSGDAVRLQQVIWNLLTNAIKFTPNGGRVALRVEQQIQNVKIQVSDTGIGIHPDFLPHVFDRFRQADSTTTRGYTGLGLGLAIVYYLTEQHRGTVVAESAGEGKGSTFTITLPTLKAPAKPAMRAVQAGQIAAKRSVKITATLQGAKILVVDDDKDALDWLSEVLMQCGAEVKTAISASAARKELESWRPNVLVSDIGMPDEDGYSLIKSVRWLSVEQGGNIPAVALTAYARDDDRDLALAAGYQMHLAKPIDPGDLAEALTAVMGLSFSPK